MISSYERNQISKEISQVREDIVRFKSEMNGLARQMNGMELYLVRIALSAKKKKQLINITFNYRIIQKTEFVSKYHIAR